VKHKRKIAVINTCACKQIVRTTRILIGWTLLVIGIMIGHSQAYAADTPTLAQDQILIVGAGLKPDPAHQTVPKNTGTVVNTSVVQPSVSNGGQPVIPANAVVLAELRGPAFQTPVTLTARPNEPIKIPPLALTGLYTLDSIRLVSGGATLLRGVPDTVSLEVIDKVIVSQVSSRPLTAKEIQDRGIVVDQDNFQVVEFTAAFGVEDQEINIEFPMLIPTIPSANLPAVEPPQLPTLQPATLPTLSGPPTPTTPPNLSITGMMLRVDLPDFPEEDKFLIPPIPAVVVIPGNIAYLNQFFSVLLMVSNVTPQGSNLRVRDLTGEIFLPPGDDTVRGTGDDPLRMARIGQPPAEQSRTQPVAQHGPDGKPGTADDIPVLGSGENGNAEFLVEGRREGGHTVDIKIKGILEGLPIGPVPISGSAVGIVEVRDPTFSLTLSHPQTITAGEQYDFMVTITNTSESPANFVSVSLLPRSISGATLLSDETVRIETIPAGDSETVSYRLLAKETGKVTSTAFAADGIPGRFELRTAVGELGIPLSPNTLILPPSADSLPAALRSAAIGLLGQAYAVATAPVTPKGLLPIGRQIVIERATELAAGGQRIFLQEPLIPVARDLTLDFLGNRFTQIASRFGPNQAAARAQMEQDFRGFDRLLRISNRGSLFLQTLADLLADEVFSQGPLLFQEDFAQSAASRPPHLSAITGSAGGENPVVLSILGPAGQRLGLTQAGGEVAREIPFGGFFQFNPASPDSSQMGLLAAPEAGAYTVLLAGTKSGTFDLGLIVPEGGMLRRLTYEGVAIQKGGTARVTLTVGGANSYLLEIDETGDGAIDRQIPPTISAVILDEGPRVVTARQILTGKDDLSRYGQLIAVLFSEEISQSSSQAGLPKEQITHYLVEENEVLSATLQPSGRVVYLALRDGIGPFVPRTLTVTGIEDLLGHGMAPASQTVQIATVPNEGGSVSGTVRRADGTPVPFAQVRYTQSIPTEGKITEQVVSVKSAGADGGYSFDFIPIFAHPNTPARFEAIDTESGGRGDARIQLRSNGQHADLDILLLGTGTLTGKALAVDGVTPLPEAVVRVSSITRVGEFFLAKTDSSGKFSIGGIPTGNLTVEAVHVATNSKTLVASAIPFAGATVVQDLILLPLVQQELKTGSLKGQVFGSDGVTPLSGIPVFTNRGGLATTDATGSYRIAGLPEGSLTVNAINQPAFAQASVATTIVGGHETTANLILFSGLGIVKGVVLDANGVPVANALVSGGHTLQRTNASGQFTLPDVPIGSRTITALDEIQRVQGSASVYLAANGEVGFVQIVLPARGTIAGRVFEADGFTPVPNLMVALIGPPHMTTVTDAQGGYRFASIPMGTYTISAFRPNFSDGNIAQGKLTFKDEVRTVNVIFRGKGTVTGILLDDDGVTPLGGLIGLSELKVKVEHLQLIDPNSLEMSGGVVQLPDPIPFGAGFEHVRLTRIMNNDVGSGTFRFENVFVGGFTVEAANPFFPVVLAAANTITQPGETAHVTLQFSREKKEAESQVEGTVFHPDGITPVGKDVVITFNSSRLRDVKVVTDEDGRYLFPLVNAGSFTVTAENPATGLVGRSDGSVIGGERVTVPIRLLGLGTVKVTVKGSNGPIEGTNVTLARGTFPSERRSGVTGADGALLFEGGDSITEGPFSVSAVDPKTGVRGLSGGTLPAPGAHVDLEVLLQDDAGVVRGRFLKADRTTGIANAQIQLNSARGTGFATTDSLGAFLFEGVAKGGVTVEAFDPVTARRGRASGEIRFNREEITVDVTEVPQGVVTGFVRLSRERQPVAGASATIRVQSLFGQTLTTMTGVDGSFRFPGISAGSFIIEAKDPLTNLTGSVSGALASEGEEVLLPDIILLIPPVGRVEGVVTEVDGTPAVGAKVSVPVRGENEPRRTTTGEDGFYFFEKVPVGKISVFAEALVGNDAGLESGEVAFDGDVERVDVRFVGTGRVTGVVTTDSGEPVSAARVALTRRGALPRSHSALTQSGLDGAFHFDGVPVGEISVTATHPITQLAGSASGVLAADGAALDLRIKLEPAGRIVGRVVREDGQTPAGGMALELSNGSRRFGSTKSDGSFSFSDLSLGHYSLAVSDPLGSGVARTAATLTAGGEVRDLGDIVLDEAPPKITMVAPVNGADRVPTTGPILVRFSEAVDPATIGTNNLIVRSPAGVIPGAWTLTPDRQQATFTPSGVYPSFTQITLRVTTGVKDRVGKPLENEAVSSFLTIDNVPPVTVSISPASGAREVALESVIRVAYSEAIDPARFAGAPIVLSLNGAAVSGRTDLILNNTVVVFTPHARLLPDAVYQISLLPATDLFGNIQPTPVPFTFATLDTQPPVIRTLTAAGGETVFDGTTAQITADLAPAEDVAFVEFSVNQQIIQTDRTAPYAFTLPITSSLGGSVTVSARATDQVGNRSPEQKLTLTIQPDAPPVASITTPAPGTVVDTGGQIAVTVHAEDDFGISRITLQASGPATITASESVSPTKTSHDATFLIDIPASAAAGTPLTLHATAVDQRDHPSPTASLALPLRDATPPKVQITSPLSGAKVGPGETVNVVVSVQDNGPLSSVGFEATGAASASEIREVMSGGGTIVTAFQVTVPSTAASNVTLTLSARAEDAAGNSVSTTPLVVVVKDLVSPTVTLEVAGGAAEAVRGKTVTVTVSATDDTGVAGLGFETQGAFVSSGSNPISPARPSASAAFVIQVPENLPEGSLLTLTGTANDPSGNPGRSPEVTLTVKPSERPTVRWTAPLDGEEIAEGTVLTLAAQASDDVGVKQVAFFVDGFSVGVDPTAPYSVEHRLIPGPDGSSIQMLAVATDSGGQTASAAIAITRRDDLTAPTVTVVEPAAGAVLRAGPSDLVLLIDVSGAAGNSSGADVDGDKIIDSNLKAEIVAAKAMLALMNPQISQVAVVRFSNTAVLVQELTSDFAKVEEILDDLLELAPAGSTDYASALKAATDELGGLRARRAAKPVQFLLSPGSGSLPAAEVQRAFEAGVTVHPIGIGSGASLASLNEIAAGTDGTAVLLTDPARLPEALSSAALLDLGALKVTADPRDDVAVREVSFRITSADGAINIAVTDDAVPFTTVVKLLPLTGDLHLTVSATARDFGGNEGASSGTVTLAPAPHPPELVRIDPPSGLHGDTVRIVGRFLGVAAADNLVTFNGSVAVVQGATKFVLTVAVPESAATGPVQVQVERETSNSVVFRVDSQCAAPPLGMVSWWTGDGTANDFFAINNGTLQNGATFAQGRVAGGFSFDGIDDFVLVPPNQNLAFGAGQDFTIEAWINLQRPTPGHDDGIVIKFDVQRERSGITRNWFEVLLWRDTHKARFRAASDREALFVESNSAISVGEWTHLVVTRQGNMGRIYINGVLDASGTIPSGSLANTDPLTIGAYYDTSLNPPVQQFHTFGGLIDEVGIYHRALSAEEILKIFNAGSSGKCAPSNQPPVVDAGPDRDISSSTVILTGVATDDNLPVGRHLVFFWKKVSGPGEVIFTDPTALNTTVTFSEPGVYRLELTADDSELTDSDEITIEFEAPPPNQSPVVRAGADQTVVLPTTVNLNGTVTDDGLPSTGSLTIQWSKVSGPGTVTFATSNQAATTVNFSEPGVYVLKLTADDSALEASDNVEITILSGCIDAHLSPVGWWKGDGNANDVIGGFHGNIQGSVTFTQGIVDQAFRFDGIDSRVEIPHTADLNFGTNDVTVTAWIKTPPGQGTRAFIGKDHLVFPNPAMIFRLDPEGRLEFAITDCGTGACGWSTPDGGGSRQPVRSPLRVDDDLFHHVAGVRHAEGYRLYVDGQLVATRSEPARNGDNSAPLLFGVHAIFPDGRISDPYPGLVDQVRIFERALSDVEVQAILNSDRTGLCGAQCAPFPGMVSWWRGEGDATDLLGSNQGTVQGGVAFSPGKVGAAFSFDGVDDIIIVNDSSNLRIGTGEMTLEAWIKAPAGTTERVIASKYQTSFQASGYALRIVSDNRVEFFATDCSRDSCGFSPPGGGGSRQPVRSVSVVADDTFHHVAGVRRADGTLEIYVDGILENTRSEPSRNTDHSDPFTIGEIDARSTSDHRFKGLMDEVALYNRALNASEIQAIFKAGSAGKCKSQCAPPPSGLVSWWKGDGDAVDALGNSDGVLLGSAGFAQGKVGQAFHFDGQDDAVQLQNNPFLPLAQQFSVEFWLTPATTIDASIPNAPILISKGSSNSIGIENGSGRLEIRGPTPRVTSTRNTWTAGTWYHVAMTYDSVAGYKLFVDGVEEGSSTGTASILNNSEDIFVAGGPGLSHFNGSIDEISFYDRALTQTEVEAIFNAGSSGKCRAIPVPVEFLIVP
jgi:PKD repeat protein